MYTFEIGLIAACGTIFFCLIRIKQVLRSQGHRNSFLSGWISDYRQFMKLIAAEEDPQIRNKYNTILLGLHAGFIALILLAGLGAFMY